MCLRKKETNASQWFKGLKWAEATVKRLGPDDGMNSVFETCLNGHSDPFNRGALDYFHTRSYNEAFKNTVNIDDEIIYCEQEPSEEVH